MTGSSTPSHPSSLNLLPNASLAPARTWSSAATRDRRAEQSHELAVRQAVRKAQLAQVEEACRLAEELAVIERRARVLTEAKFRIAEAERQSQVIAGDHPVLRAKFATLDDDMFQLTRSRLIERD